MSQTITREMIVPRYLMHFQCIGPDCPDTCCYGWQIPVEHETYVRLKNLPDKELKPLIKQALHRGAGKSGSSDFGYLSIGKDPSAHCELLSGEGLCQLHAKCGEGVMPAVCANYPRMTKSVAGGYEQFAMPSCPEVARLIVEDQAAMSLLIQEQTVRSRMVTEIEATGKTPANEEVRAFFLTLLAADGLRLWQKLALSLLVAESLENAFAAAQPESDEHYASTVQAILTDWQQRLADGTALEALAPWRQNRSLHLHALAATSRIRSELPFNRPRYLELINEALAALGLDESAPCSDEEACQRIASAPLPEVSDEALGRLLLNFAYVHYYPLQTHDGLLHDVKMLCLQFLLLRFWVVGLSVARNAALTEPELTELIYLFYRAMVHQQDYLPRCMDEFARAGLVRFDQWLMLLPD